MQVKIDTSERFHVITFNDKGLSANMTEYLENKLSSVLKEEVKNVILNLKDIESVDNAAIRSMLNMQEVYTAHKASFILCCIQPAVKEQLIKADADDLLNIVPTESEAKEIVLMEEIEREFDEE